MKALISPLEKKDAGLRIAQISEYEFEISEQLFWVDCDATISTLNHYYLDGLFIEIPKPSITQPVTTGLVEI